MILNEKQIYITDCYVNYDNIKKNWGVELQREERPLIVNKTPLVSTGTPASLRKGGRG